MNKMNKMKESKRIKFTKMHGCGNDFIVIDEHETEVIPEPHKEELSRELCTRKLSIGADGVIFVCKPDPGSDCDTRMRIFNADGTEAEMSGNGMRCFAKYVYERGLVHERRIKVETLGGLVVPEVKDLIDGRVATVRVFMGKPRFEWLNEPLYVNGIGEIKLTSLNLGNPHAVVILNSFSDLDVGMVGKRIETHPAFPNRTNVNFVLLGAEDRDRNKNRNRNEITVRTYERGVGETLSCGTGSTASVVVLEKLGLINASTPVTVHTRGGDLSVEVKEEGAYLTGPAEEIFEGVFTIHTTL